MLDPLAHREAARFVTATPSPRAWTRLLDVAALLLGTALLVAGALYLVGWNWFELGRFSRVAVSLLPMLIAAGAATYASPRSLIRQLATTSAAALSLGVLATIGLSYPSTMPGTSLPALWFAAALPWTLASRSPYPWLVQLLAAEWLLINLLGELDRPRILWRHSNHAFGHLMVLGHLGLFTALFSLAWTASRLRWSMAASWLTDLAALGVLVALAFWPLLHIAGGVDVWPALTATGWLSFLLVGAIVQLRFWTGRVRLFPAAGQALSALAVLIALLGRVFVWLDEATSEPFVFFLLFPLLGVVGLVGLVLVATWLHLGWRRTAARSVDT